MSEWTFAPFGTLADLARGGFTIGPFGSKVTTSDYREAGVPFIRGINLSKGKFHDDEFVFITEHLADEVRSANVRGGDLVFTRKGTVGQVALIPRASRFSRYVISSSQMKASVDSRTAIPEFYLYWFRSPEGQAAIFANVSTVGVPSIANSLETLRRIEVPLPSLAEQARIAEVLGTLDDKIAVNERIAAVCDQLISATFQRVMQSASVTTRLGDVIDLIYGRALREPDRRPGPVAVYGCTGQVGWHDVALQHSPSVIVGRKGANAGCVTWSPGPSWTIDTAYYVRPRAPIPVEFLYFLLRSAGLDALVGDSAVPGLNRNAALDCQVKVPEKDELLNFSHQAQVLLSRTVCSAAENAKLAELRDTLLPKLMSGEIRVRDAERRVGEAL